MSISFLCVRCKKTGMERSRTLCAKCRTTCNECGTKKQDDGEAKCRNCYNRRSVGYRKSRIGATDPSAPIKSSEKSRQCCLCTNNAVLGDCYCPEHRSLRNKAWREKQNEKFAKEWGLNFKDGKVWLGPADNLVDQEEPKK